MHRVQKAATTCQDRRGNEEDLRGDAKRDRGVDEQDRRGNADRDLGGDEEGNRRGDAEAEGTHARAHAQ